MKSIDRYLSILGLGIVLSGLSTAAYACPPQTTHGAKIPAEFTQPPKHSSQSRNHSLTPAQPTNGVKVPAEFTQPPKHSSQSRNHSLIPAQPTNGVKVPAEFTQPPKK